MIAPRVVSTAQPGKRSASFPTGKTRADMIRDAAYLLAERQIAVAAARSPLCRFGGSG